MKQVLIDTDVILDFFFDRQPFADAATAILMHCETGVLKGFVTPVIISNVYYLLRKTARHQKVIQHLKMLLRIVDVALIDKQVVLEALASDFKDFEDALQNFSAQAQQNLKVLITRNIKDYKGSRLSVMTPEMYLTTMEIAG